MSIYRNFLDKYWDETVNRYAELRHSVLNSSYITAIYKDIMTGISNEDYEADIKKWGSSNQGSYSIFEYLILTLDKRFEWLDENYFKI
jgi:hypothetical protein